MHYLVPHPFLFNLSNNEQDLKHVPSRFIINGNEIVMNAEKKELKIACRYMNKRSTWPLSN